jgi:hypothetical protein
VGPLSVGLERARFTDGAKRSTGPRAGWPGVAMLPRVLMARLWPRLRDPSRDDVAMTSQIEAAYLHLDVTKDDGLSDEERRQLFRGVVLLELQSEVRRIAALRGLTMIELADAAEAVADIYRDLERIGRRRFSADKPDSRK